MLAGHSAKVTALTVTMEIFPKKPTRVCIWEFLPSPFAHVLQVSLVLLSFFSDLDVWICWAASGP